MPVPTQDQVMAQLRIIIPALGTIVSAFGVTQAQVGSVTQIALGMVGPIAYAIVAIWSLVANSQVNKIKSVQNIATGPASANSVAAQTALINATSAIAIRHFDPDFPESRQHTGSCDDRTAASPDHRDRQGNCRSFDLTFGSRSAGKGGVTC